MAELCASAGAALDDVSVEIDVGSERATCPTAAQTRRGRVSPDTSGIKRVVGLVRGAVFPRRSPSESSADADMTADELEALVNSPRARRRPTPRHAR